MNFTTEKTKVPKRKPEDKDLSFGNVFTDHMFVMDYIEGKGWHNGKIVPYENISLDPAAAIFHYGQEVFEGLKAYKSAKGEILLFRIEKNAERSNVSSERICIPSMDTLLYIEAVKSLVKTDEDWIPSSPGTSLYIRPFIIATEPFLGVRPSKEYKFIIIMSPVGSYYKEGLKPTKIFVETNLVRSVKGGTGFAKFGGNYAASMKSQEAIYEKGCSQVLWLDGINRKYIEEIGTSNAFFKIDNKIITPKLSGTILSGITRDSVITLLKNWGCEFQEREITIDEVYEASLQNKLEEVFATGTAAVISPVGALFWKDKIIKINDEKIGEISQKLYDAIVEIQTGEMEDKFNWTTLIC